jgi:hypothetical protein
MSDSMELTFILPFPGIDDFEHIFLLSNEFFMNTYTSLGELTSPSNN